jgi:hypothetical protein
MVNGTTAARWFRRVVWVGIIANVLLALPTIAAPSQMTAFAGLPTATPDLWPRFAGVTMILLSIFYIPAALDVDRYRIVAWFTLVSRLTGVIFFMFEPGFRFFMYYDLVFLVPQAVLLWLAVRHEGAARAVEAGAA